MALFFSCVGSETKAAWFLDRLFNLRHWEDLRKPIVITEPTTSEFPKESWFNVHGRVLRRPGPNSQHPEALWIDEASLGFEGSHWYYKIRYGYVDDSGWILSLHQKNFWSLQDFAKRIDSWLETILVDESTTARQRRLFRNHQEREALQALKTLFGVSFKAGSTREDRHTILTDLSKMLSGVGGEFPGKILLDEERATTLSKWVRRSLESSTTIF